VETQEEDPTEVEEIIQKCTMQYVMSVERIVKSHLDLQVINQYIVVAVLRRMVEEEVQIEIEETIIDPIEEEKEITITDQIEVLEIQKCMMLFVMIVEKTVKFLSDLLVINQYIVVNVLKKEVEMKEIIEVIIEEAIEVEEVIYKTNN
jgi:hypothetical protein